VKDWRKSR